MANTFQTRLEASTVYCSSCLLPYLAALCLRHIAEVDPEVFEAGLPAFLNLQIGVAAPCH